MTMLVMLDVQNGQNVTSAVAGTKANGASGVAVLAVVTGDSGGHRFADVGGCRAACPHSDRLIVCLQM